MRGTYGPKRRPETVELTTRWRYLPTIDIGQLQSPTAFKPITERSLCLYY